MPLRLVPRTVFVGGLAARLLAIGGVFALAVVVEVSARDPWSERTLTALYALVLAGFLSTLGYALLAAGGRESLLRWLELVGDGVLITGLVYCTGGVRSVFVFLYIAWIVYAGIRAGSAGTLFAPVAATLGYGGIVWGMGAGWIPALDAEGVAAPAETASALFTHGAAFLLVALLASRLAREIKRGREQLHELGEIHRRIVDHVSSGLVAIDAAGRIALFNPEAERITGFRRDEVKGEPLDRIFPSLAGVLPSGGEPRAESRSALSRLQIRFENRRGEQLHLGLSHSTLRDSAGQPDGSVLIFQDLTRVVRMEEELRRSERLAAVGQLAAGLAHEIRNPLASLSGSIQLLERGLPELSADARRLVRIVERETARLNRLVVDFLSYARPGPPRHEHTPLADLLLELAALLERGGESAGVRLELDLEPGLVLEGNPDQLRQLFWNLVRNAIESGPQDAAVRIRARRQTEAGSEGRPSVEIEVADRGEGIPPELLERVFEPFFTTKATGTGLGLATVHRIVEAHGGSLEIASERGQGTQVRVRLPEAPIKALSPTADDAAGGDEWLASS